MPPHVIDFYSGWENHNQLLVRAIRPLDEMQLSWAPAPKLWSVRRLANHIVAARAWWFGGWMGEDAATLEPLINYDDHPGADERDASTICEALNRSWESVKRVLGGWAEAELDDQFQRPRPNQKGERPWVTRRFIVWHVIEHDIHHGGEISLILGMHGGRGLDL